MATKNRTATARALIASVNNIRRDRLVRLLPPSSINWGPFSPVAYWYEHIEAQAFVDAGMLTAEQVPGERVGCSTNTEKFSVRRCKDGTLRGYFTIDYLRRLDKGFRNFYGGLLTDTRLSLVRHESA